MKKLRTKLNVPFAAKEYAKENGAIWDWRAREWFVEGDVPPALEDFVERVPRKRVEVEQGPQCDVCGAAMVLRKNRDRSDQFWSCTAWPHCNGSAKPFGYKQAAKRPLDLLHDVSAESSRGKESELRGSASPEILVVKEEAARLILLASVVLDGAHAARKWLNTPKMFALGGRTPIQVMSSLGGCRKVAELLDELKADRQSD